MLDTNSRRAIITEFEAVLAPLRDEYGEPIPADWVKPAVNNLDTLSGFPGAPLYVSPETPGPNDAFFNRLAGGVKSACFNLMKGITVSKQDIEAILPVLRRGLLA